MIASNMQKFDLAIIGGGPAGMMAAIQAGKQGAHVVLLEKNKYLGVKLLITGKGRCNITNAENNQKELIKKYGENGKFLFSTFSEFSNLDVIEFFNGLKLETKVERGNRVFPISDNAKDVLNALKKEMKKYNVEIKLNCEVKKIIHRDFHMDNHMEKQVEKILLANDEEIIANNYLIATGGKSYPGTGSTGDGYKWLKELGHTIVEPKPALTPILIKENWIKKLEGLSLKNVEISIWKGKKLDSRFGEALFTADGLSGPVILDMSKKIGENLTKNIILKIDFKPALTYPELDKRIQKDFAGEKNKQFKNSLDKLLPKKLIPIIIKLSKIDENKKVNEITKEERKNLLKLFKEFELNIKGLVGFEKAIVTSGGVNLKEIDPKTCQSKIISNLYLAGEILDIDGPTGGYNLQVAWSTGYLVGQQFK